MIFAFDNFFCNTQVLTSNSTDALSTARATFVFIMNARERKRGILHCLKNTEKVVSFYNILSKSGYILTNFEGFLVCWKNEKILQAFFDGCDTRFRETPNPIAQFKQP